MIFTSFASSSAGNLYTVKDSETAVMIECGITYKRIQQKLGFDFGGICGCLLSHEHKDHAKAALQLLKAGIPVYCSQGTADALGMDDVQIIEAGVQFSVGTLEIVPFTTFHDAREPLGFLIYSRADGERLAFATDTVALGYRFPKVTTMAIESNFDKDILARCEKMPEKVQHRIANSHMEIERLCDYLKSLDLQYCREIYLLHLSDSCSHEGHFINKVFRAVPRHVNIIACPKGG